MSFGADKEMQGWVRDNLAEALDRGLLVSASGGCDGVAAVQAGCPGVTSCQDVMLRYWHASKAKNASHMLAIEHTRLAFGTAALDALALVNMDCDNVCGGCFSHALLQALSREAGARPGGVAPVTVPVMPPATPASAHAALTGRVAAWATDFLRMGGYDQESGVLGTGAQDIDLLMRLAAATLPEDTEAPPPKKYKHLVRPILEDAGLAFPNTAAEKLVDVDHRDDRNWDRLSARATRTQHAAPQHATRRDAARGRDSTRRGRHDAARRGRPAAWPRPHLRRRSAT